MLALLAAVVVTVVVMAFLVVDRSRRRWRRSAEARARELRRIYRVAERAVQSEDALDVVLAAQEELVQLLDLRDCRFEAPPFTSVLERLERGGGVSWRDYRRIDGAFALPVSGVELTVLGRGRLLGRFVLVPNPDRGAAPEQPI